MISYQWFVADEPPLLWRVLEHNSATVAFKEYRGVLQARWLLRHHPDVMLLADRGLPIMS